MAIESIVITLGVFVSTCISAIIGMGGGITLIAVLYLFLEPAYAIPVHGLMQFVSNVFRSYLFRDDINYDYLKSFVVILPIGTILGTFALFEMIKAKPVLPKLVLALFLVYVVFRKKGKQIDIGVKGFKALGFASGFTAMIFGATGPLIAPFFLNDNFERKSLIATKAICQTFTHFFKLVMIGLYLAFYEQPIDTAYFSEQSLFILFLVAVVFLGTSTGKRMGNSLSEDKFKLIYKSVLFIIALKLIFVDVLPKYI